MKTKLAAEYAEALTFQDYGPQPEIEGVSLTPLTKHRAVEGSFMEYLRITDGVAEGVGEGFQVRQVSLAEAAGGRINAFHVHPKEIQDEFWCVVAGAMQVWLVDLREGSPTVGNRRCVVLSGEAPARLLIPTGVAHGYRAGAEGAMLLYTMNGQFNPADPNEGRLPWDHFGAELWEEDRG